MKEGRLFADALTILKRCKDGGKLDHKTFMEVTEIIARNSAKVRDEIDKRFGLNRFKDI